MAGQSRAETASEGVRVSVELSEMAGGRAALTVRLQVDAGLHVYGPAAPDGYVPTSVEVAASDGIEPGAPEFPTTRRAQVPGVDGTVDVLDGDIEVVIPLRLTGGDALPLQVTVRYQACDERQCFLPQEHRLVLAT